MHTHTIIRSSSNPSRYARTATRKSAFRQPHYDCVERQDGLRIVAYIPGVDPTTIDLEVIGPDLVMTAPKRQIVRTHWRSLHLEPVQWDYQLRLRLGFSLAYDALEASLNGDTLTIDIPKKEAVCAVA